MDIQAGDRAPFDGVLLRKHFLIVLVAQLEHERDVARLETKTVTRALQARLRTQTKRCRSSAMAQLAKFAACRADLNRRERIWSNALQRCEGTAFWRSPLLWGIVGSAVGAGVCGLGMTLGN